MANPGYVRSTDGNDADTGATWALANATVVGGMADAVAGDRIWVSQVHAESNAASITITMPGTTTSPTQLLCGNDAAEPPTAMATGGKITTTGTSSATVNGTGYIYGLTFEIGTASSSGPVLAVSSANANARQYWKLCTVDCINSSVANGITIGGTGSGAVGPHVTFDGLQVKFSNASQEIRIYNGRAEFIGLSFVTGSTSPTHIFEMSPGNHKARCEVDGMDATNLAAAVNIVNNAGAGCTFVIRNSKLPASWTGSLATTLAFGGRVEMYNCDSADTNYRLWIEDGSSGSIKHETTIVRTGGASDGTTATSRKMVTSASTQYPLIRLESPEIVKWNDTTAASVTATVEIVHDSQGAGSGSNFQDDEVWLEVMYLGTSGAPLGTWASDAKADVLATAANQTTSTETWTTTGLTTPVKQKLSVTFTPQEKGFVHAKVVMAKASKTLYYDNKLTLA